eukprot:PhM_4_TR8946/c0_g1_i1/m.49880
MAPPPTWVIASSTAFDILVAVLGVGCIRPLNRLITATNRSGRHPTLQMFLYSVMYLFVFVSIIGIALMWAATSRDDDDSDGWAGVAWAFVVLPPLHVFVFFVAVIITENDWNEPLTIEKEMENARDKAERAARERHREVRAASQLTKFSNMPFQTRPVLPGESPAGPTIVPRGASASTSRARDVSESMPVPLAATPHTPVTVSSTPPRSGHKLYGVEHDGTNTAAWQSVYATPPSAARQPPPYPTAFVDADDYAEGTNHHHVTLSYSPERAGSPYRHRGSEPSLSPYVSPARHITI